MSDLPRRVVFDCNVYLQALGNSDGPSGRCVAAALDGTVALFLSAYVLEEIRDVAERPELARKFRIPAGRVEQLIENLLKIATPVDEAPEIYIHPFDADDSHYINLAVAVNACCVISRDRHLLNLMEPVRKDAIDFMKRFPMLRIISPPQLLAELAGS